MTLQLYPQQYKALLRLGIPITIAQIGFMLQGLADTLMVGQHSAQELAAAGFVNSLFLLAILLTLGFSQGAVALIGSLYSQGRQRDITSMLKSSIVIDFAHSLGITLLMVALYFALPYMRQDPQLIPMMQRYYLILLPSLCIYGVVNAFKPFFDSINDTRTSMWILLIGNLWNILFNWLLIYGRWGFPELGIEGAAWATTSSRVVMLLLFAAVFAFSHRYDAYRRHWHEVSTSAANLKELNRLGWPISIQMAMEMASFSGVSILLGWGGEGWDGVTALSAHQVMLQLANFVYMFYLGIGSAIAIRVSNYRGLNDILGVRQAANAGYQLILLSGIICGTLAFGFRHDITAIFISQEDPLLFQRVSDTVAIMAYPLILYQFGDGMQTAYVNALRGFGDVKVLMTYSFLAYIVISIPLSYLFGIVMNGGAFGIWMSFPFGLTTAAILYFRRFRKVTSRPSTLQ